MNSGISKLANPIRHYDWGSREFIARLQSRPAPSQRPEAELWIGDHPMAPSRLCDGSDTPLTESLSLEPAALLGERSFARFGPTLPFLVKILAAALPLSIQVHPDAAQAERGYRSEEDRGLSRDSAERNYRDPRRKIELMIALEPFTALCGFRSPESSRSLLDRLDSPWIDQLPGAADWPEQEFAACFFFALRSAPSELRTHLLADLLRFAHRERDRMPEAEWVMRLHALHPEDPGRFAPLLLNLVELAPGEALFVTPGTVHSYLEGSGIEVMSNSDNVVRAGLTTKHVDDSELRRLCVRRPTAMHAIRPTEVSAGIAQYLIPQADLEEFSIRVLHPHVAKGALSRPAATSAKIVLCTQGEVCIAPENEAEDGVDVRLGPGEAAWIPASVRDHRVALAGRAEQATLYEITIG